MSSDIEALFFCLAEMIEVYITTVKRACAGIKKGCQSTSKQYPIRK